MIYFHCVLRSDSKMASLKEHLGFIISLIFYLFIFCIEAENDVILVIPLLQQSLSFF